MAEHTEFEKLVAEAKKNIREISPTEAAANASLHTRSGQPSHLFLLIMCGSAPGLDLV